MSIEHLVAAYPADKNFPRDVANEREFQEPRAKVVALANFFHRKGSEGLRELDRIITSRGVVINRDNIPSDPLTQQENDMLSNNRSAVMWGALVSLFEEMIVEGVYDPETLREKYDGGFSGSAWQGKLKFTLDKPRSLTTMERTRLGEMVKKDKSFASFISKDGMRMLPTELEYTIISSGNLTPMNSFVIPAYKARADLLLGTQTSTPAASTYVSPA